MHIIGNGMIAKEFLQSPISNTCVFASGVATSKKVNTQEYVKELNLLKSQIGLCSDLTLIYFSSLSVLSFDYTEYIRHKIFMEQFITQNFKKYLILRLPNVVGNTNNKTQLLPYLYNKLKEQEKIRLKKNTYRDLLDVADIPKIAKYFYDLHSNGIFNVSLQNKILVTKIVETLIDINNIEKANIVFTTSKDSHYNQPTSNTSQEIANHVCGLTLNPYDIIKKYFRK